LESILGLAPTGRELRDPAARLIEAEGEDGRTYTVIDFDAVHDGHEALTLNVEMVLSFMEYPMVTGLVELGKHDISSGHFAYPTGSVWLLADILRAYGDFGQVVGLRAAMELAWLVGQILVEAGDTGPMQGCFSHGNLNPWRIALRADGEVQVLGYGLPQVELIRHRTEDGPPLEASSLRYCPPERLEGVPEDASSDTYSLVLVCFEVATGRPLYTTHDVPELERIVGMSEGANMLSRDNKGLPPKVAKTLARGLVYDPDTRLTGQAFVDAVGRLLATEPMDGPSLTEVVATLQGHQKAGAPKGRKLVSAVDTSMFTPQQLAELADEEDDDSEDSDPQQESRWKKVDRKKDDEDAEDDKPKRKTRRGDSTSKPRRQRRRGADSDEPKGRRRRRKAAEEDPPEEAEEAEAAEEADDTPKRRRRRKAASDDAEVQAEAASPSRTKKRRRKAPEPEAVAAPEEEEAAPAEEEAAPADAEEEPPKRRRRKAPASEGTEEKKTSSRRRRKAPADGDDSEEADQAPSRRRRKAPTDDDDDDASPPRRRRRAADDDDDDDAPRRRRRRKADDDEDDAPPRRRRRKKPDA